MLQSRLNLPAMQCFLTDQFPFRKIDAVPSRIQAKEIPADFDPAKTGASSSSSASPGERSIIVNIHIFKDFQPKFYALMNFIHHLTILPVSQLLRSKGYMFVKAICRSFVDSRASLNCWLKTKLLMHLRLILFCNRAIFPYHMIDPLGPGKILLSAE